jgi:hypothetical protein
MRSFQDGGTEPHRTELERLAEKLRPFRSG